MKRAKSEGGDPGDATLRRTSEEHVLKDTQGLSEMRAGAEGEPRTEMEREAAQIGSKI